MTSGERGVGFYLEPPLSSREEALISQSRSEREKGKVRLLFAPFVCLLVCLSPRQALREAPGRGSAAAYHTREEPFGVQAVSQSR